MAEIKTIKDCTEFWGSVVKESTEAVLFKFDLQYNTKDCWIPLSQVDYLMRGKTLGDKDKIRIKTWIAQKKGLIDSDSED